MTKPTPPICVGPSTQSVNLYAIRFSVPVKQGTLLVRSTNVVYPRALRLRGPGCFKSIVVGDLQQTVPVEIGIEFEVFAGRDDFPQHPRTVYVASDDAEDDSSDGPDVDFSGFGEDTHFKMQVPQEGHDLLHFMLTVATPASWPEVSFKYDHEDVWHDARVVDYMTRKTKGE